MAVCCFTAKKDPQEFNKLTSADSLAVFPSSGLQLPSLRDDYDSVVCVVCVVCVVSQQQTPSEVLLDRGLNAAQAREDRAALEDPSVVLAAAKAKKEAITAEEVISLFDRGGCVS